MPRGGGVKRDCNGTQGNSNDIWCFGQTGHFMGIYVYQNSSNSVQLIMLMSELYLSKDVRKRGRDKKKNVSISRQREKENLGFNPVLC